jgi:meso-butanediol dehydrogenase/(S,S)-butanediol dehydrogenase/diacetyl reductase
MNGVADELKAAARKATMFKADISKRDHVCAAIEHAEKELDGFDIKVNNAGIGLTNHVDHLAIHGHS